MSNATACIEERFEVKNSGLSFLALIYKLCDPRTTILQAKHGFKVARWYCQSKNQSKKPFLQYLRWNMNRFLIYLDLELGKLNMVPFRNIPLGERLDIFPYNWIPTRGMLKRMVETRKSGSKQ